MNYRLNHSRDLTVRALSYEDRQRSKTLREAKKKGWPAKYEGWCFNCKAKIPVLTLVTRTKNGRIVHASGCPKKARSK